MDVLQTKLFLWWKTFLIRLPAVQPYCPRCTLVFALTGMYPHWAIVGPLAFTVVNFVKLTVEIFLDRHDTEVLSGNSWAYLWGGLAALGVSIGWLF